MFLSIIVARQVLLVNSEVDFSFTGSEAHHMIKTSQSDLR